MSIENVVTPEVWRQKRVALLKQEKAFTKERDALVRQRQALPWTRIEKEYQFNSDSGVVGLEDLFGTRSQLIVYHFMFGTDWQEGCPTCSLIADGFDRMHLHLGARDTGFCATSRAPLAKLNEYKARLGWSFPWVSTVGDAFNRDFHLLFTEEETASGDAEYNYRPSVFPATDAPGLSVFARGQDGEVFHTYSSYGRGLEDFMTVYRFLDATPKGRDEDGLPMTQAWIKRRDCY